jgi:hypothetical protein
MDTGFWGGNQIAERLIGGPTPFAAAVGWPAFLE